MKLFTNLAYVSVVPPGGERGPRMMAHALTLEPAASPLNPEVKHFRLRGFGTQAEWPVFDYEVQDAEFLVEDWEGNAVLLGEDGQAKPMHQGSVLVFTDKTRAILWVEDQTRPICVEDFEDGDWDAVWAALSTRVEEFWMAPNMPSLRYAPVRKGTR